MSTKQTAGYEERKTPGVNDNYLVNTKEQVAAKIQEEQ
jgi:Ca2+-binding EF-hand superfamily protein